MRWTSLLFILVGCGEVPAPKADAAGGGTDGSSDGQAMGEATLELKLGGVATAGRPVVFSNPDGTLASEAMTNASGIAKGIVQVGAMVTVAVDTNDLITIGGVKPGDHIRLQNPPADDTTIVGIISFGTASEATNKSFYRGDLGDDLYQTFQTMASGTRTLDLRKSNIDAVGQAHIVSGVYDAANKLIAYTFLANITPTLGQTTTVTLPAYKTDVVDLTVSLTGAPADSMKLTVDSANEHAGFLYVPAAFAGIDSSSVVGGNAAVIVPYLGGFGDFVQTSALLTFSTPSESFRWTRRVPRPAGAYAIGSASMPPRLGMAAVDTSTITRPKISWTTNGNPAGGDAIMVRLNWRNGANATFAWHAYLPPDATTVTVPVVSSEMAAQAPNDTSFLSGVRVGHQNLEPLDGFDAFRSAPPIDFADPVLPVGFTSWAESETRKTL